MESPVANSSPIPPLSLPIISDNQSSQLQALNSSLDFPTLASAYHDRGNASPERTPPAGPPAINSDNAPLPTAGKTSNLNSDHDTSAVPTKIPPVSWASLIQKKKSLTKYEMQISVKDGLRSVVVPDEIFDDPAPLWEDFLIGKFMDSAPHVAKIHAIVNKIWALGDKTQMIDVHIINSTTMKFRITNPATRNRILRRGMWNLADIPVVMSKWEPFIEEKPSEIKSVPLWIHLKKVPMDLFSWKGLSFIASAVGIPDRLHPDTAQCIDLKLAKVFVKADLTKELPKSMNFNYKGTDTMIDFIYPWLPNRCSICEKWGHLNKSCIAMKPTVSQNREKSITPAEASEQSKEANEQGLVAKHIGNEQEKHVQKTVSSDQVSDNTPDEAVLKLSSPQQQPVLEIVEIASCSNSIDQNKLSTEAEWSIVSPGKSARSPQGSKKPLEYGEVSLLIGSRFSALENVGAANDQEEEETAVGKQTSQNFQNSDENQESKKVVNQILINHPREEDKGSDKFFPARQPLPRASKKNQNKSQEAPQSNLKKRTTPRIN